MTKHVTLFSIQHLGKSFSQKEQKPVQGNLQKEENKQQAILRNLENDDQKKGN